MFAARTLRTSAAALAALVAAGTIGTAPAMAGKPPPAPTGLTASATAHQDGSYDVTASWNAVASATSYRVSLTKSGATLSSTTVTTTSWAPTVTATPGNASLSVRAVVGKRPGKTATLTVPLADVTAPQGSYSSSWSNDTGVATITEDSLTDNSPVSGVTRTVNWDDGTSVAWPTGTTITHSYSLTEARYVPTVTLEDAAHNQNVVDVPAALAQRGYQTSDAITLDVAKDDLAPWNGGRIRLECSPDGAAVAPSQGKADVALSVKALASLYSGYRSARQLAQWGMLDGDDAAVERATRIFATWHAPHCPDHF